MTRSPGADPRPKAVHLLCLIAIASAFAAPLGGCASWKAEPAPDTAKLAAERMAPPAGHLSLQTMFLRLEGDDLATLQNIWPQLDEISFDLALRRELEQNGIRCGVVLGAIPPEIQRLLDRTSKALSDDPMENVDLNSDVSSHPQTIVCKSGTSKDLTVKPQRPGGLTVLHRDGTAKGRTYQSPALMLKLCGVARDGGGVRLSVQPFIEHGEYRSQVTGQAFALRREVARETQHWPALEVTRDLQPNQILVLGSTEPPKALGAHFFTAEESGGRRVATLLLIRVGSSDADGAFAL